MICNIQLMIRLVSKIFNKMQVAILFIRLILFFTNILFLFLDSVYYAENFTYLKKNFENPKKLSMIWIRHWNTFRKFFVLV